MLKFLEVIVIFLVCQRFQCGAGHAVTQADDHADDLLFWKNYRESIQKTPPPGKTATFNPEYVQNHLIGLRTDLDKKKKMTPAKSFASPKSDEPFSFDNKTQNAYNLHRRLFRDHYIRRLVKPISEHGNETLLVKIHLALIQLMDIDELNQVMTTNVWLYQEWQDHHLAFSPIEHDGIKKMDIPAHMIWLPDIVLYNSADGLYAVPPCLRVRLTYDGTLQWDPPVIYQSFCEIDIKWFPFDQQNCSMKFGSWSYDGFNINLIHKMQVEFEGEEQLIAADAIDFENYRENTEWTVIGTSAKRTVFKYSCCPTPYIDVTFYILARRKPLFIVINLLFPCFIISFLSVFVFYLPAQSGEKMSLSVSILVALIMFFLVVFEKIPATSLAMPLFAKFLIFTLSLVTLSIVLNAAIIRIHWMAIEYPEMPRWIRKTFIETLAPRILNPDLKSSLHKPISYSFGGPEKVPPRSSQNRCSPAYPRSLSCVTSMAELSKEKLPKVLTTFEHELINEFTSHAIQIYGYIYKKNSTLANQEDWRVVALIVDKIFFYIFVVVFATGTTWIFWHALWTTILV